jgi:hypothetical protein
MSESHMSARLAVVTSLAGAALIVSGAIGTLPTSMLPAVTASAAGPQIGFEVPRVADPIHTYGEPDIGVEPNQNTPITQPNDQTTGYVYVSGPTGTGAQRSIWQGSVDGGHTFRNIQRNTGLCPTAQLTGILNGAVGGVLPQGSCFGLPFNDPLGLGGPVAAPGGGDTELQFDGAGRPKQYFADLYALACQHTAVRTRNADGTETLNEAANGGCPIPGSDRQWIVVKDNRLNTGPAGSPNSARPAVSPRAVSVPNPLVYMEVNDVAGCGTTWLKSPDGLNYSIAQADGEGVVGTYCPYGADGYPAIYQPDNSSALSYRVFQAEAGTVSNSDATPAIKLNIGTPIDASGDLCFLDPKPASTKCPLNTGGLVIVAKDSPVTHAVAEDASEAANFTVSSIDTGGNLWVAWVGRSNTPALRQTWVAVASKASGWKTFSQPVKVSTPPSAVSIFPFIQAGGPGRADVVWYGSDVSADPSSKSGQKWNVFMSQVVWPLATQVIPGSQRGNVSVQTNDVDVTQGPQSIQQVKVTPHPMKFDDVCLAGTACITQTGNRNLADFFEIKTDNTGAAMIVYNDMGNHLTQLAPAGLEGLSHIGAPVVTVARQSSGPGLFSNQTVTGPSNAPVPGLPDAAGDALFTSGPPTGLFGGTNIPGMDIVSNSLVTEGQMLHVTTKIAGDPRASSTNATAAGCPTCNTQFVTRWQLGDKLFYAMMENVGPLPPQFFAGTNQVIDDCSVSACDPHVLVYPELPPNGVTESGAVDCPGGTISAANPCTITIDVPLADVGSPTNNSLLEEVGSYALTSPVLQSAMTQLNDRVDNGAREVDGVCCYNFHAAGIVAPPPGTTPPTNRTTNLPNTGTAMPAFGILLIVLVGAPLALDAWARRRRAVRLP